MRIIIVFISAVLFFTGCGSSSDSGRIFIAGTGHPDGWSGFLTIGTDKFHGTVITSITGSSEVTDGAVLFVQHCAVCHGNDGTGKIGPSVLGTTIPIIESALRFVPLMEGHRLTLGPDDILDIHSYITDLAGSSAPVDRITDTSICTECHGEDLAGGISLISCFSCHDGPDGDSGHPEGWPLDTTDTVAFHGKYGSRYDNACRICHGINLTGGIGPACSICHDGTIAPPLSNQVRSVLSILGNEQM